MKVLWRKLRWAWIWAVQILMRYDQVTDLKIAKIKTVRVGKWGGGAWRIPKTRLHKGLRVVSVGVGEESSFDEQLLGKWDAEVFAFDPTPKAAVHAASLMERFPLFYFEPLGLWDQDGEQLFYAPPDPTHVSHSLVGLRGETPSFTAQCLSWESLLTRCGGALPDVLKMDIEGAEYAVVKNILSSGRFPSVICLEFDETHSPMDAGWRERIRGCARELVDAGYQLVGVFPKGNYTFMQEMG
ncbi:FkbM family methyltransferase [Kiritimatiellota bacterium B12222]|nr:FkbM family methyltransferase [Kiritimatiellota bacterium B12222]